MQLVYWSLLYYCCLRVQRSYLKQFLFYHIVCSPSKFVYILTRLWFKWLLGTSLILCKLQCQFFCSICSILVCNILKLVNFVRINFDLVSMELYMGSPFFGQGPYLTNGETIWSNYAKFQRQWPVPSTKELTLMCKSMYFKRANCSIVVRSKESVRSLQEPSWLHIKVWRRRQAVRDGLCLRWCESRKTERLLAESMRVCTLFVSWLVFGVCIC